MGLHFKKQKQTVTKLLANKANKCLQGKYP